MAVGEKNLWTPPMRIFKRKPSMPRGPWLWSLNNIWKPQGCADPRSVSVEVRGRQGTAKHHQGIQLWRQQQGPGPSSLEDQLPWIPAEALTG